MKINGMGTIEEECTKKTSMGEMKYANNE